MSHKMEFGEDEHSSESQQSPGDGTFHARFKISCGSAHHLKKFISERYIEEERSLSLSPPLKKQARFEHEALMRENSDKTVSSDKAGSIEKPQCSVNIDPVYIKPEPPDDEDRDHTKRSNLIQSLNTRPRSSSLSLHSTIVSSVRKSYLRPAEFHSVSNLPVSGYTGISRLIHNSRKPDHTFVSSSQTQVVDRRHEPPDSSTGTCEQLLHASGHHGHLSAVKLDTEQSSGLMTGSQGEALLCQVCGDLAAGFYCDAYICEACKKFFIRASKLEQPRYVCLRQKNCIITKESRVHCQYCRFQKCLQLNMHYSKDGQKSSGKVGVQEIPCRVCSAPSSGFHFGALTCEGCKGFFRRMVKEREAYAYKCSRQGKCNVNAMTRNICKACRYHKCLQIGMSVEGSRIGRQPNAVKHAISLEAKKQAALKTEVDCGPEENASPSSFSFDSVILDHCSPGEVENDLPAVNGCHQECLTAPCRKVYETQAQRQPSFSHCDNAQTPTHLHCSDRSDIPQDLSLPTDRCELVQTTFAPSLNSSADMSPLRNVGGEVFISASECQPQDLSLDLSLTGANSSGPDTTAETHLVHRPVHHPDPSPPPVYSNMLSHQRESLHVIAYPLSNRSAPQCYRSVEYVASPSQPSYQSYFLSNPSDAPEPRITVYRPVELYSSDDAIFSTEAFNQIRGHTPAPEAEHEPAAVTYKVSSAYDDHFTQPISDFVKQRSIISNQQHIPHFSHLDPEMLLHPSHHLPSRDDLSMVPGDQQFYPPPQDDRQNFRRACTLHKHPEKSCQVCRSVQPQNFKTHPPQWPQYPTHEVSKAPASPMPSYTSSPLLGPPCTSVSKQPRQTKDTVPESIPGVDLLHAPSPSPIPEKVADSRDQNLMSIPNHDLNMVVLDAAKNLAHFCVVNRAKSSFFNVDRFKDVDSTWEKMMEHFHFHAKCIVRFAKRVPGFRRLKIDDQVVLLRMGTYGLVILNHSRAYELDTGFYNYFNFTQNEISRIAELFPEFDVIHGHYKHAGLLAQQLGLTDMEYAYLSCLLLLNDESLGLEDIEKTRELRDRYRNAFQEYEFEHFPNGGTRFRQMLVYLSEFSSISMEHNIAVGLVITKNSQLHIPQLYAEMYTQNNGGLDTVDSGS